jgi:GH24 family phage-related lysozyme (muramidase)
MSNRKAVVFAMAVALAIPAEGLRQVAYTDPPGILTVCYGHTGKDVVRDKKYSLEECRALLDADMRAAIDTVDRCHPGLPEPVLAAFSDAAFHLGPNVACNNKKSTASRYLSAGRFREACEQLPRWVYATVAGVSVPLPGIVKRREAERVLCLEGVSDATQP